MDRYLRPERLDADPNSSTAKQEYQHWKRTFDVFLVSIAEHTPNKLETLYNFVSPKVYSYIAEAASYEAAIEILKGTYIKEKNIVFARYQLSTSKQESGEGIDEFVHKLRTLAADIEYKPVTADQYRSNSLTDAFIQGVNSNFIRQRLLESNKPTFQEVYTLARSLELAQKNSEAYLPPSASFLPAASVHSAPSVQSRVQQQFVSGPPGDSYYSGALDQDAACAAAHQNQCYNCGGRTHPRSQCPARDAYCHQCKKKGHFKKVCRRGGRAGPSAGVSAALASSCLAPLTSIYSTSVSAVSSSDVFTRPVPFSPSVMVSITIKSTLVHALVDTGSKINCLDSAAAQGLHARVLPTHTSVFLAAGYGSPKVVGECVLDVTLDSKVHRDVKFIILEKLVSPAILGEEFLEKFESLTIKFQGAPKVILAALSPMDVPPPRLFRHLTDDVYPVRTKTRKFSLADTQFIRGELDKLLANDIIEPSFSPWRAQVHITTNDNHKRRMVVDYSRTINKFTLLDAYPSPDIQKLVHNVSQYNVHSEFDMTDAYHQSLLPTEDREYTAFEACGKLFQFKRMSFGLRNAVACFQRTIDDIIQLHKLKGVYVYVDNIYICGKDQCEHDSNLRAFLDAAKRHDITFNPSKTVLSTKSVNILGYTICNGKITPNQDRVKPLLALPIPKDLPSLNRALGMFAYYAFWIPQYSDKVHPLSRATTFPLHHEACVAFDSLKASLAQATLGAIDEHLPFTVETDASDIAISASLNQNGRPVAFMARTLHGHELKHTSVEKEAYAIVEALRKWKHFLINQHFTLVTDQKPVSFMFGTNPSKVKNDKIMRWRLELSPLSYTILYRPGKENVVPDTLSRAPCSSVSTASLMDIHISLCHPGITRLTHFVRSKNLPYSVEDIKRTVSSCSVCCELKPNFFKKRSQTLIKATQPFQCLDVDFKGPLPSSSKNKYILTVIDEWSRFPFAFPTPDITATTVTKCLNQLFVLFGMPGYIHSDRGAQFLSAELKTFLHTRGVATSRTTSYNPQGNGLTERYNGIIWKAVLLSLKSRNLPVSQWETVLPDALHSIRSLLCTSTNATPHERFFNFPRTSTSGVTLPSWLTTPGSVLLKRHVRPHKADPLVDEVQLLEANPNYAHVRYPDGRETTVSLRHLAPTGNSEHSSVVDPVDVNASRTEPTATVPEPAPDPPPVEVPCDSTQDSADQRNPMMGGHGQFWSNLDERNIIQGRRRR